MDPRVKLFFIIGATTIALLIRDAGWMLGFSALVLLVSFKLGLDSSFLAKRLKHFVPVMLMAMLSQLIFVRTGRPVLQPGDTVLITSDALQRALSLVGRLIIIFSCAGIMIREDRQQVITALSKMKIPYMFSFMLMIALRFIPVFARSFSQAMISLQLRGIDLSKVPFKKKVSLYSSLMLPVVSDAMLKSQDLGISMEARGFRAYPKRTYAREVSLSGQDIIWLAGLAVGFVLLITLYLKGFGR